MSRRPLGSTTGRSEPAMECRERPPARLKSKIYSALVSRMAESGSLLDLAETKSPAVGRLCVFENALTVLPPRDGNALDEARAESVTREYRGANEEGAEYSGRAVRPRSSTTTRPSPRTQRGSGNSPVPVVLVASVTD